MTGYAIMAQVVIGMLWKEIKFEIYEKEGCLFGALSYLVLGQNTDFTWFKTKKDLTLL
jgi:hypothetical protein